MKMEIEKPSSQPSSSLAQKPFGFRDG